MVRDVVAHGARQEGCSDAAALAFGCAVEDAIRQLWAEAAAATRVSIVVRGAGSPLQVVIGAGGSCRTLALEGRT